MAKIFWKCKEMMMAFRTKADLNSKLTVFFLGNKRLQFVQNVSFRIKVDFTIKCPKMTRWRLSQKHTQKARKHGSQY